MQEDEFLKHEDLDPNRPGCWSQGFIAILTAYETAHSCWEKWEKEQNYWLVYGDGNEIWRPQA